MNLFRKYFYIIVLFSVWFASILLTWRIVENPYWDFAELLYDAERVSLGQTIYRDFQHPYPPLICWLYGGIMRIFPDSYAAVSIVSALSALLFLISNYKISRLFHSRSDALKIAIVIYLALFTASSVAGENFITFGLVFVGITVFNWLAWFAVKFLRDKPPDIPACLSGGVLAGLCLLSKHERAAGVLGILGFLALVFLFWKRNRIYLIRLLVLVFGMLIVGVGGYWVVIIQSGWFNVLSALTQSGMITSSATHNIPALIDIGAQIFLAVLHFGFIMLVAVWAILRCKANAGKGIVPVALKYVFGAMAICVSLLVLESVRVVAAAKQIDFGSAKDLTRTMATISFYSTHGEQLAQSVINYFGSIFFSNILPMLTVIIFSGVLLIYFRVLHAKTARATPSTRWLVAMLLLCAAFCVQARVFARRLDFGALTLVLPVFFLYAERIPFIILRLKPKLSLWRTFKRYYLSVFLLIMLLAASLVYAYEFRDVLVKPIKLQCDKGLICLPDLPMNRAFAQLISYLRDNRLTRFKIVAVPTSGIQYWIGGEPSPFAWGGPIQPETYRSPWSDNLKEGLARNDCVFVEFGRQTGIQSVISAEKWSWIDGPAYRLERWKNTFPLIWNHIQSNTREVAVFGPTNDPYFEVYVGGNLPY